MNIPDPIANSWLESTRIIRAFLADYALAVQAGRDKSVEDSAAELLARLAHANPPLLVYGEDEVTDKSPAEIRRVRDDMAASQDMPCGCAASGHKFECEQGRIMTAATIDIFGWILGEPSGFQNVADVFAKRVHG
jgi:hypothetical protein